MKLEINKWKEQNWSDPNRLVGNNVEEEITSQAGGEWGAYII